MTEANFRDATAAVSALPPARQLIAEARAAMEAAPDDRLAAAGRVLDAYKPAIDELVDAAGAAAFMGYASRQTIATARIRQRADGSKAWPDPDGQFGRSSAWRLRTIVLHQAQAPGRGHPGASLGRSASGRRGVPRDGKGRLT